MTTDPMINAVYEWKHYAARLTGSVDNAKDLLHDVFVKMFVAKERLPDDPCQLRRIAHAVMKNLHIDNLRKARRRAPTVPLIDMPVREAVYPKFDLEAVNRLLQTKIGRKQRQVFMMHLDGYEIDEISEKLKMKKWTVYGYTNQTKTKLKSLFEQI